MKTGASIPSEAMMHFPPVSDFPPPHLPKLFFLSSKFYQFSLFPKKFPFSSDKISDDLVFFSHRPQISDFLPYFALFYNISLPDSRKFIISPCFQNFPPP